MPQAIRRTRAKQTDANFDFRQISFYNLNSIEDCYAVFKLKPTCSFKVLREKYIRMSTHYHPRAGINWKTKHFIRVVLAYQCLERYHQERKKNGYIKREEFFRHWQQNHMTHDLDRACAYSRISRVLFERVLYPRFNKIRSIIFSVFFFFIFLMLMIPMNEYYEGRASWVVIILFPAIFSPVIYNLLKTRDTEKAIKQKLKEITQL